jgi:transcriptional regulator with XRE-family HTH domain
MAFDANLRRLMGMHGVQQRELAEVVGISKQAVFQLLSARHGPSLPTARRLSALFGVELGVLLDGSEAEAVQAGAANFDSAPIRSWVLSHSAGHAAAN